MTLLYAGSLSYPGAAPGFVTVIFDTPAPTGVAGATVRAYTGDPAGQGWILRCFSGLGGGGANLGDAWSSFVHGGSVAANQPSFVGPVPSGTRSMEVFFGNVVSGPAQVFFQIDDIILGGFSEIDRIAIADLDAKLDEILAAVRTTYPT